MPLSAPHHGTGLVAMKVPEHGNERCLGPIFILQQPLESRVHIPRLMENQA